MAQRSNIPISGYAWPKLKMKVDTIVKDFMTDKKLPGMTVAVSKEGRLILSKGYGWARPESLITMEPDMHIRIGSITKAAVTGPAGWQLMESKPKPIDPKTQTLYGAGGLFGHRFDTDIEVGITRHNPIIDLAFGPDDRVYAWYTNGTVSIGSSNDLDRHSAPMPYILPPGKRPVDVRAIAIGKNRGNVFVWYEDRTRSMGTPTDLAKHSGLIEDPLVSLPRGKSGKSIHNIVGVDFAKSDDHAYIWYDDGEVSSGTFKDFDAYFGPRRFTYAPSSGGTSYNIRGMGIASDDHVYAWFSNGFVSSGTTTKLDQYRAPYQYSIPASVASGGAADDWRNWYRKITIQNLLDHKAGFVRDGNKYDAAEMFKTDVDNLTFEQVHKHFLRTRKLMNEPGTKYSYSNEGFVIWTLLIEAMSGKSYRKYVQGYYLKPMFLERAVLPDSDPPDSLDAWNLAYKDKEGNTKELPFVNTRLGIAAGGFRSSAQSLVRVMRNLEVEYKYTIDELDNMGWGKGQERPIPRLSHSGGLDACAAYAVMFPNGYIGPVSRKKLDRVHVAVITNIEQRVFVENGREIVCGARTDDLERLANNIAVEVPDSNVAPHFDIWRESSKYLISEGNYQKEIDRYVRSGYRLVWIDGYDVNGKTFFNVIFRFRDSGDDPRWVARHGLNRNEYQREFDYWTSEEKGFRLAHIESYLSGGSICYAPIFVKSPGPKVLTYGWLSATEHQQKFDRLTQEGWVPVNVSVVSVNGALSYCPLYEKKDVGASYLKSFMTLSEFKSELNKNEQAGRKLVYLNSYTHNNAPRFVAIWHTNVSSSDIRVRHGLSGIQYQNERDRNFRDGYLTRAVTGYEERNRHCYAAFWSK